MSTFILTPSASYTGASVQFGPFEARVDLKQSSLFTLFEAGARAFTNTKGVTYLTKKEIRQTEKKRFLSFCKPPYILLNHNR